MENTKPPVVRERRHALVAAGALLVPGLSVAQLMPKISQGQIDSMFANMRAHAPWSVDGPLLWGFFFFDADRAKLEALAEALEKDGFRLVSLSPVENSADHRLHVERVETLTPTTLYARNVEFEALARRYRVRTYDGMDVGPALKPPGGSSSAPR